MPAPTQPRTSLLPPTSYVLPRVLP
jgi:hypothetical protein